MTLNKVIKVYLTALVAFLFLSIGAPISYAQNTSNEEEMVETFSTTYPLEIEILNSNGQLSTDTSIYLMNEDSTNIEGSFNEFGLWQPSVELNEGLYYISLVPPISYSIEINYSTLQFAQATGTENLYSIALNDTNLSSLNAIQASFNLIEEAPETYNLGVEVFGLDGTLTNDYQISVANYAGEFFEGYLDEFGRWMSASLLPKGNYVITLTPPAGTMTQVNENIQQFAVPTEFQNQYIIELNGTSTRDYSTVFGAFNLVKTNDPTYRVELEIQDSTGKRMTDIGVSLIDGAGLEYSGSFNDRLNWLSDVELPQGSYTIQLSPPEGLVSQVNESINQFAVPTEDPNVFYMMLNDATIDENNSVHGAFILNKPENKIEQIVQSNVESNSEVSVESSDLTSSISESEASEMSDESMTESSQPASKQTQLPATGESKNNWLIIAAIAILIIGGSLLYRSSKPK